MPLNKIRTQAAAAVTSVLQAEFDHTPESIHFEVPPRRDLGDLAWPGALPLAKVLRMAPRKIAETIAAEAQWPDEVERVEVAGPGFLNLWVKPEAWHQALSDMLLEGSSFLRSDVRGTSSSASRRTSKSTTATCVAWQASARTKARTPALSGNGCSPIMA